MSSARRRLTDAVGVRPRAERVCDWTAAALILAALIVGVSATYDLAWPYDPDHFRDISFAQTARDGHPFTDPFYRGEWIWYNPLLAWVVAALSALTRTSVAAFHVHAGPVLNLFGPITFYLLARRVAGPVAALFALAAYLFFLCDQNCWACATYSPWLFTSTFAQGLFFGSVLLILDAAARPTLPRVALAGTAIGVTFLGHTAPALLLGVIALGTFRRNHWWLAGGCAVVAASPFLFVIVGRYHFHILNRAPLDWQYGPLTRQGIGATLRAYAGWMLAAGAGLWLLRSRLVSVWLGAAVALTLLTVWVTAIVPAFHFWLYVLAAMALLSGVALSRVIRRPLVATALTLSVVAWHWPAYAARQDFTVVRSVALDRDPHQMEATRFLRRLTTANEVVLGTYGASNLIIGPAGRKTVAPFSMTANPYVAIAEREADRDAMLAAIRDGDYERFASLTAKNQVTAVVSVGAAECAAAARFPDVVVRAKLGDVCVSSLRSR